MAFVTISNTVPAAATFNQAGTGKYVLSTSVFGGLQSYYLIAPAKKIKSLTGQADYALTMGVTRYAEADVVVNGVTRRIAGRVRTIIEVDNGYDLNGVDAMVRQSDEFITLANMNRMANGEV